jgi:hypothetical protein
VPKSRNSRPIPFSLQREVQEQIEEMLADNIIEESYSSYVSPLTLVQLEGKRVQICLDAREVNKFMTPDRAKVSPMQTLLQRSHGANFISTLDLNSAFLQIPLDKMSRKWMALQFQNTVYGYSTRVPFRYQNSLSVFITESHVSYSDHHNSSRFTFPIFMHSWHFSVFHSLQSIMPRIY